MVFWTSHFVENQRNYGNDYTVYCLLGDVYSGRHLCFSVHLYPSHSQLKHVLLKCWQISIKLHHVTFQKDISFKLYTDNKKLLQAS